MAEVPERVYDRFITKQVNAAGIYLVTLYINGVETPVIVDDHLPTRNGDCAFAKTKDGELWVSLLEKAWAKVHHCYTIMEGGFTLTASLHLQGVPGYEWEHSDYTDSRNSIIKFWNNLFLVVE